MPRECSRGHNVKPREGVCPRCMEIVELVPDLTPTVIERAEEDHGATVHPRGEWE